MEERQALPQDLRILKNFSPEREQRERECRQKKHRGGNRNVTKEFPERPNLRRQKTEETLKRDKFPQSGNRKRKRQQNEFQKGYKAGKFLSQKIKKTLAFYIISCYIIAAPQNGENCRLFARGGNKSVCKILAI